jgi:protein SCO1/2
VLVSIDPERDTPQQLRDYGAAFGMNLIKLTGDATEIAHVAREFGVAVRKQSAGEDGSYSVSHSTDLFLATRDGRIIKRFELITPAAEIAGEAQLALSPPAPPLSSPPPSEITANLGRLP